MNDKKHTPEPWRWSPLDDDGPLIGRNGKIVLQPGYISYNGDIFGIIKASAADKKLIAAAPDMLEALKNARQFISNGIQLGYIDEPAPGSPEAQTLGIIVDAIRKAEVNVEVEK